VALSSKRMADLETANAELAKEKAELASLVAELEKRVADLAGPGESKEEEGAQREASRKAAEEIQGKIASLADELAHLDETREAVSHSLARLQERAGPNQRTVNSNTVTAGTVASVRTGSAVSREIENLQEQMGALESVRAALELEMSHYRTELESMGVPPPA